MKRLTKQEIAALTKDELSAELEEAYTEFWRLCAATTGDEITSEMRVVYAYEKLLHEEKEYRRGRDNAIKHDVRRTGSFFS